jgi:hypothetical protein
MAAATLQQRGFFPVYAPAHGDISVSPIISGAGVVHALRGFYVSNGRLAPPSASCRRGFSSHGLHEPSGPVLAGGIK